MLLVVGLVSLLLCDTPSPALQDGRAQACIDLLEFHPRIKSRDRLQRIIKHARVLDTMRIQNSPARAPYEFPEQPIRLSLELLAARTASDPEKMRSCLSDYLETLQRYSKHVEGIDNEDERLDRVDRLRLRLEVIEIQSILDYMMGRDVNPQALVDAATLWEAESVLRARIGAADLIRVVPRAIRSRRVAARIAGNQSLERAVSILAGSRLRGVALHVGEMSAQHHYSRDWVLYAWLRAEAASAMGEGSAEAWRVAKDLRSAMMNDAGEFRTEAQWYIVETVRTRAAVGLELISSDGGKKYQNDVRAELESDLQSIRRYREALRNSGVDDHGYGENLFMMLELMVRDWLDQVSMK